MTFSHTVWAGQVASSAELPEVRLQGRLAAVLVAALEQPVGLDPSGRRLSGPAKATYRFYANPRVTAPMLRSGFAADTARRSLEEDIVLVVQDTTSLNFTGLHISRNWARSIGRAGAWRASAHRVGRDRLGTGHRDPGPAILGAAPTGPARSRGKRERQVDQRH